MRNIRARKLRKQAARESRPECETLLMQIHDKTFTAKDGKKKSYRIGTVHHHPNSARAIYQNLKRQHHGRSVFPRAVPKAARKKSMLDNLRVG